MEGAVEWDTLARIRVRVKERGGDGNSRDFRRQIV